MAVQSAVPVELEASPTRSARADVRLAGVVAVLYFATAYASLVFGQAPDGMIVLWPASGIAVGLVYALGRRQLAPIAFGTAIGSLLAQLASGRGALASSILCLAHAAEAIMFAWLPLLVPFNEGPFRRLFRVLTQAAAAAVGCGLAALAASVALAAAGLRSAPADHLWPGWLLAGFVGVSVVAPLVTACIATCRALPRGGDWSLDLALLGLFAFVSHAVLGTQSDSGGSLSIVPGAVLLPLLMWVAARTQPIVPAVAIAWLALLITYFVNSGTGRYGDPRLVLEDRLVAAQVALTVAALATWSISALFMSQRHSEERLRAGERRLASIASAAPGVLFSLQAGPDGRLSLPYVSSTSQELLGIDPVHLQTDAEAILHMLTPVDREAIHAAFAASDTAVRLELPLKRAGQEAWIEINARSVTEADSRVVWHGFIQDITARRRLLDELNHRTRNLMSVVQSVADLIARETPPAKIADSLGERLSGLAASHHLLASSGWQGAEIGPVFQSQLAHLVGLMGSRLHMDGPAVVLRPPAAQVLGMAVHELATNAAKHGAFSPGRAGTVRLSWSISSEDGSERFVMTWEEHGGIAYSKDGRRGFGHKVLIDMAAYQLGAHATLEPATDGLIWRVSAPGAKVLLAARDRHR